MKPPHSASLLALAALVFATFGAQSEASPETVQAGTVQTEISGTATLHQKHNDGVVIRLEKAAGRATVVFNYPAPGLDLSKFRDLTVAVGNRSATELDVLVAGASDFSSWSRNVSARFLVRPAEQIDLRVLMTRAGLQKDHPLVKRLGRLYGFPGGHHRHYQYMDNAAILRVSVRVDWLDATPGELVTISRPFGKETYTVNPAMLETLDLPLVDIFGQARDSDWPGKVTGIEQLRADAATDLALVASVTEPGEGRSRFGGEKGPARLQATGFFRTEKIDGKWWFVDPEGHLFWSLGVNCAGTASETRVKGREELFPESNRNVDEIYYYFENLARKHGDKTWSDHHADVTLARMMDWGLNTIGAWSRPDLATKQRVPYTLIVHTDSQGFGEIKKIPDPYSDAFKKSLHTRLAEQAAQHAKSPWLLGVFIDNELEWKNGTALVDEILKSPPATPARRALVEFLKKRHGDLNALNKAWGASYESWDALHPLEGAGSSPAAAYSQDLRDCLSYFAEAYFAVCKAAIDEHFPNHLYLGCRFNTLNPLITAAASRHCDVLSANLYRYTIADLAIAMAEDKPVIVGEFHFGTRDHGNWGVGLTGAADTRNQTDLVQAYLSGALRHPNIVGAHWFQWSNQVQTGRFDGENFGVGLVTVADRPISPLVDAFRTVANALYDYRRSPTPARIGAPVRR